MMHLLQRLSDPASLAGVVTTCIVASGLLPASTAAQDVVSAEVCEFGRISSIFIDNHDIYDLEQLEQGGAVKWAYSLANALHIRTAESFIRRELLFEVGDCLDPLRLDDTASWQVPTCTACLSPTGRFTSSWTPRTSGPPRSTLRPPSTTASRSKSWT
jgi:hypothetical protein